MLEEIKKALEMSTYNGELVFSDNEGEEGMLDIVTKSGANIAFNIHPYDAVLFSKSKTYLEYLISEVERLQAIEKAVKEYTGPDTHQGVIDWLESVTDYKP